MLDLNLITDRTAADVENGTDKGYYRHTDLNRVQAAVVALRARFVAAGYSLPETPALSTWYLNDIPRRDRMERYLRSVRAFDGVLAPVRTGADFPSTMDGLDWRGANAIEEFLDRVDRAEDAVEGAWFYCDEPFSGEVDV